MVRYTMVFLSLILLGACSNNSGEKNVSREINDNKINEKQTVMQKEKVEGNEIKEVAGDKDVLVLIKTPYGNMKARLYNKTPKHRDNFVKLIRDGWYKNSPFHRVIKRFMIQGGQKADGTVDIGYTIPAEFVPEYIHKKGALAAARIGDQVNPQKASSGNQFYIVQGKTAPDVELNMLEERVGYKYTAEQREIYKTLGGTPFLDYNYTVFGEVFEGLEVIDKIAAVQTDNVDKPLQDVTMQIEIIEQ